MDNRNFKFAVAIIFVTLALLCSYFMHFFLPQKAVFEISGTDAKRIEGSANNEDSFYIYASNNGKLTTFRNLNTGFGFPFYFKFSSTDMQGEAKSKTGQKVLITFYGWRNKYFDTFPNILRISDYKDGMSTVSLIRGIVYTIWLLFLLFIFPRFYSLMERKRHVIQPRKK